MIKKADVIIALGVIAVALGILGAFFLFSQSGGYAVVKQNGTVVARLPLAQDGSTTVSDEELGHNTIVVKGGKVWVESADCSEQICVNHKPVNKEGEIITCLPHKLTVEIIK